MLALLLILGAYAVGRAFAGKVNDDASASSGADRRDERARSRPEAPARLHPGAGQGSLGRQGRAGRRRQGEGDLHVGPRKDASGAKVSYAAANLTDGVADTTWRCDGTAIGKKIILALPDKTAIGEVGLIPGYAKTDDATGDDRYAENNRVTRVRWTIGDIVIDQKMNGSTDDRSLRLLRVPRTEADEVQLEILAVAKGPRNTTAISEVQLGRAG